MAQHRRDHRHHAERKRARRTGRHPHHEADGGPEPGGPLMMTRNRGLMTAIAVILVAGLIAFGIVWALAWG
jgi:hypothetical protein